METCTRCGATTTTSQPWARPEPGWALFGGHSPLCPECYMDVQSIRKRIREYESEQWRAFWGSDTQEGET